jgi:hypothetical protein
MKPTPFLFSFCILLLTACGNDDEVNIVVTGTTVAEAFPYATLKIQFNNPDYRKFDVFFGDKPSVLNSLKSQPGSSDGMTAIIPASFPEDTEVEITLKAEGKTFTVPGTFKIKALPKIVYTSSNKIAFRKPLKLVIKNKEYFNNGSPEISFCRSSFCASTDVTTNGDTLLVVPNLPYASGNSNYELPFTLKIAGMLPPNTEYNAVKPLESITTTPIYFRPTYKLNVYKGKPGDSFLVDYNNAKYFADEMTFKFGTTTVPATGIEFSIGGLIGFYKIPNMLPGTYNISVTDKENMEYLPETGTVFVVE